MALIKHSILFLSILLLSGCSLLMPARVPEVHRYQVNAMPSVRRVRRSPTTIMVLKPTAKTVYSSKEMVYSTKAYEMSAYAVNEWSKTPADMLQPLIAQTLNNTNYFHAVVTPPFVGQYTYSLSTQIYLFLQDYTSVPGVFRLVVHAQISRVASSRIIGSRVFKVTVPIESESPYAGVQAANRATQIMLGRLTRFTLRTVRAIPAYK